MAAIKIAYIGAGGTRGAGCLASFSQHGAEFAGSEIVLTDPDAERLELTGRLGRLFVDQAGVDITIRTVSDRRQALDGADAVLTSFRPGGFEARIIDEKIPLKYGVIGQETQGPGGFFMALRSIHAFQAILADIEALCPDAWLVNYTNPVNIVAEAIVRHTPVKVISLCEGSYNAPRNLLEAAGLESDLLDHVMIGLNHQTWSIRHEYDGEDLMPLLEASYDSVMADVSVSHTTKRLFKLACRMKRIPMGYWQYYYYTEEILAKMKSEPMVRAEVILGELPTYLAHYREQADSARPRLDPARSRGGVLELELAVEVISAIANDSGRIYYCNVPNRGAVSNFRNDLVVEVPCHVDRHGAVPITQGSMPREVSGLMEMLAEYQTLAADVGWNGTRADALRALAANPLVGSFEKAEPMYDEMAVALSSLLPQRLLS